MESLWASLWRKWLDPGGFSQTDHLCDHLRRDIGLIEGDTGRAAPIPIRDRNLSDPRTFCTLQAYR